ncbi:MAG: hypothetical protein ACXACW_14135, partial [Candidatus Hodarchaeales archaeon]
KSCENNFVINAHPTGRFGYWKWIFETTYEVNINCHSECGEKVKSSSYRRRIIVFIMILVALISYIYFDLSKITGLLLAIISIAPPLLWSEYHPQALECIENYEHTIFSFKNERYAHEFAILNNTKIKGEDILSTHSNA